MRLILFLLLAYGSSSANAILDGDQVSWHRHSYLVKVFAKGDSNEVKSCSGTLISSSLVLTATSCIVNDIGAPLSEFALLLSIRNNSRREQAVLVEKTTEWALLKIHDIELSKLCPPDPEPKGVRRLNLKPTLKASSVVHVTRDEIMNSNCYLIGFNTTELPTRFFSTNKVFRLNLGKLYASTTDDAYLHARIEGNFSACFEDAGAPLICDTTHHGELVVGIFEKLSAQSPNHDGEDIKFTMRKREHCLVAREMLFSLVIEGEKLVDFVEEFDIGSFVSTYEACGFLASD